ncbi:MAG: PLP-dependent aminotransferase family protein [Arenicella sp.]
MKKYESLAKELTYQIRDGQFQSTLKLPSVRQLCERHHVSLSTVVRSLQILEESGLIESRERSGFYIKPQELLEVQRPNPTYVLEQPTKISNKQLDLGLVKSKCNPHLCDLGSAIPDQSFFPVLEIDKAFRRVLRSPHYKRDHYQALPGYSGLRHQIALYMQRIGYPVNPDSIVVTSGCQEAFMLGLRTVTEPGDTVAVETPTYPGFLQVCDALHLNVIEIPTDPAEGISIGALELAIEQWDIKACLLCANYSNPTGGRMPTAKKKRLVQLCSKNSIRIVEDDVYGDISFDPFYRPKPLKSFDNDHSVIYCNSFSKTISPGLRVGWVINEQLQMDIEYNKYVMGVSSVTTTQHVVYEYLKTGKQDKFLQNVRHKYSVQLSDIIERVHELFPANVGITQPRGGFILWIELPKHVDTLELLEYALHEGVSFKPGVLFSASQKHRNCLRLNCARELNEQMDLALKKLAMLCHQAVDGKYLQRDLSMTQ